MFRVYKDIRESKRKDWEKYRKDFWKSSIVTRQDFNEYEEKRLMYEEEQERLGDLMRKHIVIQDEVDHPDFLDLNDIDTKTPLDGKTPDDLWDETPEVPRSMP